MFGLSLIKPYLTYAKVGLVVALVVGAGTTIGVLWHQKTKAEAKVASMQVMLDRLHGQVDAQAKVIDDQKEAIAILEITNQELNHNAAQTAAILEEIRNAPQSDDGPVAPVLLRALRRIDGMQPHKP